MLFGKPKEEMSLMLDVGNGSITGALVLFKKDKKPEFLYSLEVPFVVPEKPSSTKLIEDMTPLLNTLLETIYAQGFKSKYWDKKAKTVFKVLVAFSSPWFVSKTKHITLAKEKDFVITQSLIDSIIKDEEAIFKKEIDENNDYKVIDSSIVHTRINGYTLETSIGKKTKSLDAYLYMSMVSQNVIKKIEDVVLKHFHIHESDIHIHTFPLISFSVVRDIFSANSDFVLIDVTSEVTDLTLVEGDVIKYSASVPSGKNFLLRQIMKTFSITPELSESTLNLFINEKLNNEDSQKMEEVILNVEKEWSIYLENGLSELSSEFTLPSSVYLTCDNDVSKIYINFLKLSKTDGTAIWRKSIQVNYINQEAMTSFLAPSPVVKWNEFGAILAVFYNKMKGY